MWISHSVLYALDCVCFVGDIASNRTFLTSQPSSGYYDPSNQYAPGSLGGSRNDGSSNLNSQLGSNTSATTAGGLRLVTSDNDQASLAIP